MARSVLQSGLETARISPLKNDYEDGSPLGTLRGNLIHVGVAEWKTARSPDALRTTLGSCVGVVLYSASAGVGGLAHALLADPPAGRIVNRAKYARTSVEALIRDLRRDGAGGDTVARIFGGASMFESFQSPVLNAIGEDNVRVAREVLERHGVPVRGEAVGGNVGRSLTFFVESGLVVVRVEGREEQFPHA